MTKNTQASPSLNRAILTPRAITAVVLCMALFLTACSGYEPARRDRGDDSRIDAVEPIEEGSLQPGDPSTAGVATATATAAQAEAAAAAAAAPRTVARGPGGTVVTQAPGGVPKANIWPDSEDKVGITNTEIRLCMHAAFIFGDLFNNHPEDEDIFWRVINDTPEKVHGRRVNISYIDDQYTSAGTNQALAKCQQDSNPFLYLGGVGFDQAPAGREWAEQRRLPYLYNMAVEGRPGTYSFTMLPSLETNGRFLGQFTASRLAGRKFGAIYVNTENWKTGFDEYEKALQAKGMRIEPGQAHRIDNNNHPDFNSIIFELQRAGVNTVLGYMNALAMPRFIIQADGQDYHPVLLTPSGFDLITDTAGNSAQRGTVDHMRRFPAIYTGWVTPAYEIGPPDAKARPSVAWYAEMQAMKAAYRKYKPEKTPNDADWMFWIMNKMIYQLLIDCSKDCSRNVVAGLMLSGYKTQVLDCPIDFSLGRGRMGGHYHHVFQSQPAGQSSFWRQIETCKRGF